MQTFPDGGGKWQVSNGGGGDPSWRADGKELFYRSPDQKLMAVEVGGGGEFQAGIPQALFSVACSAGQRAQQVSFLRADGKSFLFVAPLGRDSMTPTTVVLNWFAELGG